METTPVSSKNPLELQTKAFDEDKLMEVQRAYAVVGFFKGEYGESLAATTSQEQINQALTTIRENAGTLTEAIKTDDYYPSALIMMGTLASSDREEIAKVGIDIVKENIGLIIDKCKALPRDDRTYCFDTLVPLLESSDPDTQKIARETFAACFPQLQEGFSSCNFHKTYTRYAELLLLDEEKRKDSGDLQLIQPYIANITDDPLGNKVDLLVSLCSSDNTAALELAYPYLDKAVEGFGLNPGDMFDAWRADGDNYWQAVGDNLSMIRSLEAKIPGISAVLQKEFGIHAFRRYSQEMLVQQYEQRNEHLPYGVIIYPKEDHNGAFTFDWPKLDKLRKKLEGRYAIRVLECDGKYALARTLLSLGKRYGDQHKISFALIGGHGEQHAIHFGDRPLQDALLTEDLAGPGAQRSHTFFEPNPSIVLAACSTGKAGGIAQKLSEVLHAEVTAPASPTSIQEFDVIFDQNNRPKLSVNFAHNPKYQDVNRVYSNGIDVSTYTL